MVKYKNITLKNFLSTGQVTQAVNFDQKEVTLILGENLDSGVEASRNGTGKTALMQALSYALFGTPINDIRKDNLVNRTNNKNMLVTLEFSVDGIDYKIERGRKPNILKFYINNVQQQKDDDSAQGENKETQQHIEKVLNMSGDMFKHIVALNTYTQPFLALKNNEQREIIEQLLGITLLSEKAEKVKEQIRKTKDNIQQEEFLIKAIEEANKRVKEQIDATKRRQKLWQTKHDTDLKNLAIEYESLSQIDIQQELQAHKDLSIYLVQDRLKTAYETKLAALLKDLDKEYKVCQKLEKEIKSLQDHKCYACGQDFHDAQHSEVLNNKIELLNNSEANLKDYQYQYDTMLENPVEVGTKPTTHYATEAEAVKHSSELENLIRKIEEKSNEVDPYHDQIIEMESKALQEISFEKINTYTKLLEHQKFLLDLLTSKDSFVRKRIIDQNLNYLNTRLTYYLDKIGLPHQVVFKNDLQVEITELGREMDFFNLSRGEMNRVILSLSWAFRDVYESLYSPINIMFIDELLDNGLDAIGVENSLAILKDMARRRKKSVWLVSHREELSNRVPNILKVIKEGGFTSYSNITSI